MNPIALITGGSRGIGAATALLAAERGFAVVIIVLAVSFISLGLHKRHHTGPGQLPLWRRYRRTALDSGEKPAACGLPGISG